ncbi:type IV secretory pathway VirD4 components [Clostridium sp. CAG:609]|nr:type IV secretory pathway VirD4 components [Clostridium sp. CAG:609]
MKFKVEPKDFLLFVVYCGLLLYLCAIAVLNFVSLSTDGTFYGLLPFLAFTPKYIAATLILFIISLVGIFTSVSSYIFKKDKDGGFGIILKKKSSDGYSSWAKDKDIKEQSGIERVDPLADTLDAAGIPLINNGKEMWVDNGEYHNLVIGSTGSGKTQTVVKPMVNLLAKKGESMIITDPKGEIYKYSASYLKEKGYKIIVLNFREPNRGNSWNPLTLPFKYYRAGNPDKAIELLNDVALNILYDPSNKNESDFWEKSAADYFSGLALGLFQDGKEEEVNLNSINVMSTVGEERYATSNYIKEYFGMKGEKSNAYMFASSTINAPNDTKGGLLATFRQKIRNFSTGEALSEMLSYSDFDMKDIGNGKTAVFMIIHDEKKTYHSLMTIFIKQCYETLIDAAQENGGKLPVRTNFILDEFANMPPLKDVDAMVSAARSRDIRFTFIIQNFAQLNDVYGDNVAEIIKGNCGNIVYLISTEMKALEEISKMCGEVKVTDEKDKNATRPLITITDLQKMKLFEAIIIRLRTSPFRTKLEPDFKMEWGIERREEEYPTRAKREVQIFDLKEFVMEQRNKKMSEEGNNFQNNNPFRPIDMGMGFSPFSQGMGMPNFGSAPSRPSISDMDIDSMLKDLDEKFKELDRQEAMKKEVKEEQPVKKDDLLPEVDKIPEKHEEKQLEIVEPEEVLPASPVINVDKDSKVIDDSVVSDDEFFDDFFGDE